MADKAQNQKRNILIAVIRELLWQMRFLNLNSRLLFRSAAFVIQNIFLSATTTNKTIFFPLDFKTMLTKH